MSLLIKDNTYEKIVKKLIMIPENAMHSNNVILHVHACISGKSCISPSQS